jgi:hypothetical protein
VVAEPTTIDAGWHDTVTIVIGRLPTVTVTRFELTLAPTASVTLSSKPQVPLTGSVGLSVDGSEVGVQPSVKLLRRSCTEAAKLVAFLEKSHWHVYGEVPPLNGTVVLRLELWPGLIATGFALIVGGVGLALTVTITAFEYTVTGLGRVELSVTSSSKLHVSFEEVTGEVQEVQRYEPMVQLKRFPKKL